MDFYQRTTTDITDDIVLRLTDLQNDKRSLRTGLVKEHGIITSAYTTIKANRELVPEFFYCILFG